MKEYKTVPPFLLINSRSSCPLVHWNVILPWNRIPLYLRICLHSYYIGFLLLRKDAAGSYSGIIEWIIEGGDSFLSVLLAFCQRDKTITMIQSSRRAKREDRPTDGITEALRCLV